MEVLTAAHFWEKVDRSGGPDACWLWQAGTFPGGYGAFNTGNRYTTRAHRVALQLSGVEVAKGALVCHSCDTPLCCNPRHLWIGDHASNAADCVAKGRHSRGAVNGNAKLTADAVRHIRARCARGCSQIALAAEYKVAPSTISHIHTRRNWSHV